MKIIIKKNNHLSNQLTKPRLRLWEDGEIVCKVKFTEESIYLIPGKDAKDWNKLSAGVSWGFFPLIKSYMAHWNSSRWGWRFDKTSGKIEITPYFYNKGVRRYAETLKIKPIKLDLEVEYQLTIKPIGKKVLYSVDLNGENIWWAKFFQEIPSIKGWILPAYFGGNNPAPKDVSYNLTYL